MSYGFEQYGLKMRQVVTLLCGRWRGEKAIVVGESSLNMDYVIIVWRLNPRARRKTAGVKPKHIQQAKL